MFKLKIKGKIIILTIGILVVFGISILAVTYGELLKHTKENVDEELSSSMNILNQLLDAKYAGGWRVDGDKLYKGSKLLNEDTEFVDAVKSATGDDFTVFLNDTRIATSIISEGKRATGTKAAQNVSDTVLIKGKEYKGVANILGHPYRVKYIPIKDSKDKIIGMLFLGINQTRVQEQARAIMLIIAVCTIVFLLIASLITSLFSRKLSKPLNLMVKHLQSVAEGDLSSDVPDVLLKRNDEIGELVRAVEEMQNSMGCFISNVLERSSTICKESSTLAATSESMASSSQNIATAISDVASGTANEASDLVKITMSLNEFGRNLDNIIGSMTLIHSSSLSISTMTNSSNDAMGTLIDSIKATRASLDDLLNIINGLEANLNQINEITAIINGIADQTNLLALNAAIEAARAGEAGKGFAVVSNEIRKLAEESKISAGNISNILETIDDTATKVVSFASRTNDEIAKQSQIIDVTVTSFKQMTDAINAIIPEINMINSNTSTIAKEKDGITEMIEGISAVAEEVSASSEEISATTQQMTSASQEAAATAQSFEQMTKEMLQEVRRFKIKG